MKTIYTLDDEYWLEKIFGRALMATDIIYNYVELSDHIAPYLLQVLDIRAKIFEYLGEKDYNEHTNEQIKKRLLEQVNE